MSVLISGDLSTSSTSNIVETTGIAVVGTGAWSVAMLFQPYSTGGSNGAPGSGNPFSIYNSGNTVSAGPFLDSTNAQIPNWANPWGGATTPAGSFPPGAWVWLIVTCTGSGGTGATYYAVPGGAVNSGGTTTAPTLTPAVLRFAADNNGTTTLHADYTTGMAWNRVLSAAEIAQQVSQYRAVARESCIGEYLFRSGALALRDDSGKGNHLTIVGSGVLPADGAIGPAISWGVWPKRKASRVAPAGGGTITGSLSTTLTGATMTGTAGVRVDGSLSSTLAGATVSATGAVRVDGALSKTLAGATLTGSAFVGNLVTGSLNTTLAGATLSATGRVDVAGTAAITLSGATIAASGQVRVGGTLAVTLAGASVSAAGGVRVDGSLSKTLAGATLNATAFTVAPIFPVWGDMAATVKIADGSSSAVVLSGNSSVEIP